MAFAAASSWSQEVDECSEEALRAAIEGGGFVAIEDCTISISNKLVIETDVVLIGTGTNSTIDGTDSTGIVEVMPGGRFEATDMTFTGGSNFVGGAILIHEGAEAVFSNCVFSANVARGATGTNGYNGTDYSGIGSNGQPGDDGSVGFGGAIFNLGTVTVLACQFVGNQAIGGTGGKGGNGGAGGYAGGNGERGGNGGTGRGGAIYNSGTLYLVDSLLDGNTALGGTGGLGGNGGEGPQAGVAGSGGYGARAAGAGVFSDGISEIWNCTFYRNIVTGGDSASDGSLNGGNLGGDGYVGGGSFGGGLCNLNSSWVTNCTFVLNRAIGGRGANGGNGRYEAGDGGDGGEAYGGGIYVGAGYQWLMNLTVATNVVIGGTNGVAGTAPSAGDDGDRGPDAGANIFGRAEGEVNIQNSIFAYPAGATSGAGSLVDRGGNIATDLTIPGALVKAPLLSPFGDYGGPTPTMLPQPNSPAVGGGNNDGAPEFDQRGLPREDTAVDSGAVERQLPVIVDDPESVTVGAGSTVTFTVRAEGDAPFGYQWRRNGANIPGATRSFYTISNVTTNASGIYTALVTNVSGSVDSGPAILVVVPAVAPQITTQPEPQTAPPNTTVRFTVGATGTPPLFVQWRSNNVNILRATNWTLTLSNIRSNYSADYSASVTNSGGSALSQPARLTVAAGAPLITNQPAGQSVMAGATVTFTVGATGTPPLFVQWRSNNVNIPLATDWSLTLTNVQTSYSADYTARVTNAIGAAVSDIARLRVGSLPAIAAQPISADDLVVLFPTENGARYVLEASPSLASPNWVPVSTNIGNGYPAIEPQKMDDVLRRFYRVRGL